MSRRASFANSMHRLFSDTVNFCKKTSSTNKYLAFGRKKAAKVETQRKLDATQNLLVARPAISLAAC